MMMKADNYWTVCQSAPADLDQEVRQALKEGWALYGEPRYQPETKHTVELWQQTLVKPVEIVITPGPNQARA